MSEPTHISELLPGLMADIDRRILARAERHRRRVTKAILDFHEGRKRGISGRRKQGLRKTSAGIVDCGPETRTGTGLRIR